jgi:acyl carrier protein
MEEVERDLRSYVVGNFLFGREEPLLGNGDSLMERGVVDSTGVLELIQHLEASYGIKVEDEELIPDNLDSISNLARFVLRKTERPA